MNFTQLNQKYNLISILFGVILNPLFFVIRRAASLKKKNRENLIIIAYLRIGDTVFSIPAIKRIIYHHKQKIMIVCSAESELLYKEVFTNVKYINLNSDDFTFGSRIAKSSARNKLSDANPKIIYDITNAINSATLLFNTRAKEIIGSNEVYFKSIYDQFIEKRKIPHLTNKYIDATGIKDESPNENIPIRIADNMSEGAILIHPFAGWKAKEWNLNKFIELAKRISSNHPLKIVAPINKFQQDIKLKLKNEKINFVETESINQLIEEIKKCSAFIGGDSGPLYIASLFGKPTFTIYGPTNPDFSKPVEGMHEIINLNLDCSPKNNNQYCFTYAGTFCPAHQCMNLLTVKDVYSKLNAFLKKSIPISLN